MAVAEAGYEVGEEELEAELKALVEEEEREKMEKMETVKVIEMQEEREKKTDTEKGTESARVHEKEEEERVPVAA